MAHILTRKCNHLLALVKSLKQQDERNTMRTEEIILHIIGYIIFLLIPCAIFYVMGSNYTKKIRNLGFPNVLFRPLLWSLALTWSILGGGSGHTGSILPVPSWLLLALWLSGNLGGIHDISFPHPLLTPLIPIACYLMAYYRGKHKGTDLKKNMEQ